MRRSGKSWYRNERETMGSLGLAQVPGSGNGWVAKEDGENEHVLCQLKSTDGASISVKKVDIDKLLLNAEVERKIPVFAVQFLSSGDLYLLVRPLDLPEVARYIETGVNEREGRSETISDDSEEDWDDDTAPVLESSQRARERFSEQNRRKYEKKERSAL